MIGKLQHFRVQNDFNVNSNNFLFKHKYIIYVENCRLYTYENYLAKKEEEEWLPNIIHCYCCKREKWNTP